MTSVLISYGILIFDPSTIISVQPRQVKTMLGNPAFLSEQDSFCVGEGLSVGTFLLFYCWSTESDRLLSNDSESS